MLNSDELMTEWAEDCKIDRTKILERMSRHPILHSKYLTHLQTYKIKLRSMSLKYQKLRLNKMRYYSGELCEEDLNKLGWKQYLYKKPLRSEMESLLEGDSDLQTIQDQMLYVETLVSASESILKDITNQYYIFKTIVDYTKFEAGV